MDLPIISSSFETAVGVLTRGLITFKTNIKMFSFLECRLLEDRAFEYSIGTEEG